MSENLEGTDWVALRPKPSWDRAAAGSIDSLVPEAPWFWEPLQRFCVPDCCGLAAYNFDEDSVAWTCHLGEIEPEGSSWRYDDVGDPSALAEDLHKSATAISQLDVEAVSSKHFNDLLPPQEYASLCEELAAKIEAAAEGTPKRR